jgi:hypothetical protein
MLRQSDQKSPQDEAYLLELIKVGERESLTLYKADLAKMLGLGLGISAALEKIRDEES